MESITEMEHAVIRRASLPLPRVLSAFGSSPLVESLAGRCQVEDWQPNPRPATNRIRLSGSDAPSPIAVELAHVPSAAFAAGKPIYAAAPFRTQGLSVTPEQVVPGSVTTVTSGSVDSGISAGAGMQQGTGVSAASAPAKARVVARGIPPRGRPDC